MNDLGLVESEIIPVEGEVQYQRRTPRPLPESLEDRLEYTQSLRTEVVDALTSHGIPTDKDNVVLLLGTLKDMDAQTLGKMKQNNDDNAGAADRLVARAIAMMAQRQGSSSSMRVEAPVQRAAIPLDSQLPDVEVVPGELDQGGHTITYNEMASRFARNAGSDQAVLEHKPD